MDNTIQLYTDEERTVKGYPITSPDRVIDEDGRSVTEQMKSINEQLDNIENNISDIITIKPSGVDDTEIIQNAIKDYSKVILTKGEYKIFKTLQLKDGTQIIGDGIDVTVFNYQGEGYCFCTSDTTNKQHWIANNRLENFTITGKNNTISKGGIMYGKELDYSSDEFFPFSLAVNNVHVKGFNKNDAIGINLLDVSHAVFNMVKITNIPGSESVCMQISSELINTGVDEFNCCQFGDRVDCNLGLKMIAYKKSVLDSFSFNGCYFGGKKCCVLTQDSGYYRIRTCSFSGCHFEAININDSHSYIVRIDGGMNISYNNCEFVGATNTNHAFYFSRTNSNIKINAQVITITQEHVYSDNAVFNMCEFTGLSGFSGYKGGIVYNTTASEPYRDTTTFTAKKIVFGDNCDVQLGSMNIVQNLLQVKDMDGNIHKIIMHWRPPTTGTYKMGDRCLNSAPTVGSPKSWVCTLPGTPGTWVSEGNL